MKFVALVSGGKDSCFNIMHCQANGHELVCLANLYPKPGDDDEIDSFMYQTVGYSALEKYSECIGKPMYRRMIEGTSSNQKLEYKCTEQDETEDLYLLLEQVISEHPEVKGVSVGAILSNYQRTRVEDVCSRLGLTSLSYLWQRNQSELMGEMVQSDMEAILIKVAAIGLNDKNLGMTLAQAYPVLTRLNDRFGVHVCGEGGEFETLVLDAPFFTNGRLILTKKRIVRHTNDEVWYLKVDVEVVPKEPTGSGVINMAHPPLLTEPFDDIVKDLGPLGDSSSATRISSYDYISLERASLVSGTIYISNLCSSKTSTEDQIIDIFDKLKIHLDHYNVTFANIQSANLFISDMSEFAAINAIYKSYFTEPLPPARCCVETALPEPFKALLSVRVIPDLTKKHGLHVQSRSYWAPSNIGPYSQTVSNGQVAYLSGQIPLIPKNMELELDPSLATCLSLQHLHRVKEVTGYTVDIITVAFVTDASWCPLVRKAYTEYAGDDLLIIVQVTGMPKGAPVEWSALTFKDEGEYNEQSKPDPTITFTDTLDNIDWKSSHSTVYGSTPPQTTSSFEYVPCLGVFSLESKSQYSVVTFT